MHHPLVVERPRQFKVMLSNLEWERLVHIAEADDLSASELLRAFINRRYREVTSRNADDVRSIAGDAAELARRLRALSSSQK